MKTASWQTSPIRTPRRPWVAQWWSGAVFGVVLVGCGPNGFGVENSGVESLGSAQALQNGTTAAPTQPAPDGASAGGEDSPEWNRLNDANQGAEDVDIAVIGDSLAVSAEDEISQELRGLGFSSITTNARVGRRISEDLPGISAGLSALENEIPDPEAIDVWVIALGTNDVGSQARPQQMEADIDLLLNEIGDGRPVVWLDVFVESRVDGSAEFGDLLRTAAIERGSMVLGDWFYPAQEDGMLATDGVHLTPDGRQRFAEVIADGVGRLAQPSA